MLLMLGTVVDDVDGGVGDVRLLAADDDAGSRQTVTGNHYRLITYLLRFYKY